MTEKKPFNFPDSKEREKRLDALVPKFRHENDGAIDKKSLKTLVKISLHQEEFAKYFHNNTDHDALKETCRFISDKTPEDKAARKIQDELLNGLLRRKEKYNDNTPESNALKEIIYALLETNVKIWINKAKKKDNRLNGIEIQDMLGEAFQILEGCIRNYNKNGDAHFKTYAEDSFKHFGTYYKRKQKAFKDTSSFTDLEGDDSKDNPRRFVDTHKDHREDSASDNATLGETTKIVRQLVEKLPQDQKRIIEAFLEQGGKDGAIEHIKETKNNAAKQHYKRAIKMLERLMKEDPRFNDRVNRP